MTRLEMSPPCRSVRTFTLNSPRLPIFSPPGPTYRCPFTGPFEGFRSTSGRSSGFTTYSPVPESTVISRYRPCLPSVSAGLLSMDMLPIVTAFSSTSSGHHSSSLELSFGTASSGISSGRLSLTGDVILVSCSWQLLAVHTQLLTHRADREVHRSASFCIGCRLRCVPCPRIRLLLNVGLFIPTIKERRLFGVFFGVTVVSNGTFDDVSCSSSSQLPTPFVRRSTVKVSLCSAIGSDVANAPAAKTFFVGSAFLSTCGDAFDRIVPGLGENFLAVSSKRYNSPFSPSTRWLLASSFKYPIIIGAGPRVRLWMTVTMCALICASSGNKRCCAVNSLSHDL